MLTEPGHDFASATDRDPMDPDADVLAMALKEGRELITYDKDFGELGFVRGLPHPRVTRFVEMRVEEKVSAMRDLIERRADAMQQGALIVVTQSRVRVRYSELRKRGNG